MNSTSSLLDHKFSALSLIVLQQTCLVWQSLKKQVFQSVLLDWIIANGELDHHSKVAAMVGRSLLNYSSLRYTE